MHFLKRAVRRVGAEQRASDGIVPPRRNGIEISRRDVLPGGAATATAAMLPLPALAAQARIAIVGAGLAGLSAAHELRKTYGLRADV